MTPNLGQGANIAIENAAALANHLYHVEKVDRPRPDMLAHLRERLKLFEKERKQSSKQTYRMAYMTTRLQARDGRLYRFIASYIFPHFTSIPSIIGSIAMGDGTTLDYLPLPARGIAASKNSSVGFLVSALAPDFGFIWKWLLSSVVIMVAIGWVRRSNLTIGLLFQMLTPYLEQHKEL
jgi:hypothetical protein